MPEIKNSSESPEPNENNKPSHRLRGEALRHAMLSDPELVKGVLQGMKDLKEGRYIRVSYKTD